MNQWDFFRNRKTANSVGGVRSGRISHSSKIRACTRYLQVHKGIGSRQTSKSGETDFFKCNPIYSAWIQSSDQPHATLLSNPTLFRFNLIPIGCWYHCYLVKACGRTRAHTNVDRRMLDQFSFELGSKGC